MLLAAVYVGMDVQLRTAEEGRTVVDQSQLARVLLGKMTADLAGCLTPIAASKATLVGAVTGTNVDTQLGLTPTALNMGLQGDNLQVTVYVSGVPRVDVSAGGDAASAEQQQQSASDIRRVTYWLAGTGLAKQEVTRVTADDDSTALPPAVDDESKYVIADEVTGLNFRYFDGTSWVDSWDGSSLGADGKTPIGPPRAVEVTLTLRHPGTQGAEAKEKTFRHVVAVAAANAQPTQAGADTSGSGTASGTSSTGGSP